MNMQGSFWTAFGMRFGSGGGSGGLDELLEKEDVTVEEVLDHEDVIQECKYMNAQLIEFLSRRDVIEKLISYVIERPPAENTSDTAAASTASASTTSVLPSTQPVDTVTPSVSVDTTAAEATAFTANTADSSAAAAPDATNTNAQNHVDASTTSSEPRTSDDTASTSSTSPVQPAGDSSSTADSTSATDTNTDTNEPADFDNFLLPFTSKPKPTATPEAPETIHRYPYVASELFACEVVSMLDVLFEDTSLLDLLFNFLDRTSAIDASNGQINTHGIIDPSSASYFRKVVVVLIQRKYEPLVKYIATHNIVEKLVQHIGLYSVMELLIMIGWDDGLGQTQDTDWLYHEQLVPKLVNKLSPQYEGIPDVHMNAARALVDVVVKCPPSTKSSLVSHLQSTPVLETIFQHMFSGSMSSLTNAMSIIIVLIQRYANRKAEMNEMEARHSDGTDIDHTAGGDKEDVLDKSPDLMEEPFTTLLPHLPKLMNLLKDNHTADNTTTDSATSSPPLTLSLHTTRTQFGQAKPFGETRMKVVELCLVLFRSHVPKVDTILIQQSVLSTLLQSFFAYPWNNMLHGLVESIIRTVLDSDSAELRQSLIEDGQMVEKFVKAFEMNAEINTEINAAQNEEIEDSTATASTNTEASTSSDEASRTTSASSASTTSTKQKLRYRPGYMGHLIRTATAIDELNKQQLEESDSNTSLLGSKRDLWMNVISAALDIELDRQKVGAPFNSEDDLLDSLHFDMPNTTTTFVTGSGNDMQLDDTDAAFEDAFGDGNAESSDQLGFHYGSNDSAGGSDWNNGTAQSSREATDGDSHQYEWADFNNFDPANEHTAAHVDVASADADTLHVSSNEKSAADSSEYDRSNSAYGSRPGTDAAARTLMQFNVSHEEEDDIDSELVTGSTGTSAHTSPASEESGSASDGSAHATAKHHADDDATKQADVDATATSVDQMHLSRSQANDTSPASIGKPSPTITESSEESSDASNT